MRTNKYTGKVYLPVEGVGEVRLRFDWEGIAELKGRFGAEWEKEVQRVVTELDARGLAEILAIGSEHDADWWMEKSPPFVRTAQATQEALHVAFFGAGALDERPTLARRLMTRFSRHGRHGSNSAGEGMTSGA